MKNILTTVFVFLIIIFSAQAQFQKNLVEENLKKHISFLADDQLEGRRAGTEGEKKAMNYIAEQFKITGLQEKGTQGYFQPFEIKGGKRMGDKNSLLLNKNKLQPVKDYFVLPFSANKTIKIKNRKHSKLWLVNIDTLWAKSNDNPHFDVNEALYNTALEAQKRGAASLFFYNTKAGARDIRFNKRDKSPQLNIPVVYINQDAYDKYLLPSKKIKAKLSTEIIEDTRTGHNVIGYIDNNAATTVVLGAHFDHLGYGEDGNSMLRTEEKLIHNGADDNASGTAALMELATLIKASLLKNNNYLFIAFSAEEIGLFGSKFFVDHPTIDLAKINYMINMDMVGRLNDSTKALTIGGFGTSPAWETVIKTNNTDFNIKIDSSGAGPSDHTSFYRKDIPVLFYFTGLHHDYHKPSDDYDKINYKGEALIVENIFNVVKELNAAPKLAFLKTREMQVSNTAFKVTLGIMPDYTYSGTGVKADGVTEGRPAAKAGLKAGDIIIGLGDFSINDMDGYMKALNKFKKGDKTIVKFRRGTEVMQAEVTF